MQQATRIILIRHGQTDWNAATRIQGHTDIALNHRGRWQAQRLGQSVGHEALAAVYASDLARAVDTAQPVAAACGLQVQTDVGLRERGFGVFEGRTFAEIETLWPDQAQRWRRRDPRFGPEGGETLADFYERSVRTVHALARRHEGQAVAMVSHGGVLDCLYRAATGQALDAPRTWEMANAGINRLLKAGEILTLVGWADLAHLDDEPDWRGGDPGVG